MGRQAPVNIRDHIHLAVLVPHRDSRKLLRSWSAELFAAGMRGAWSFPHAAPLALLSRPLLGDELKYLAHSLRALTLAGGRDGKLRSGPPASLPLTAQGLPDGFAIYGPALDITISGENFSPAARTKPAEVFFRPLLGSAVLGPADAVAISAGLRFAATTLAAPPPEAISFRAAAVANLRFGPLSSGDPAYSFSWEIGELYWLPAIRQPASRPEGEEKR
ncbi:MAG: hypothetical protein LBT39_04660 [Treponema sp.]|jgi:hypothetical protein|nr:hypothetical protein [Treponema sp.]